MHTIGQGGGVGGGGGVRRVGAGGVEVTESPEINTFYAFCTFSL